MADSAKRIPPSVETNGWLSVPPPATRLILHGEAGARSTAAAIFGVGFADTACRATLAGRRATLWLGPDEFLLLDSADPLDGEPAARLAAELTHALAGVPHALVDVSHRQFALQVSGADAAAIVNGACPLDLDPAAFPVGMCTRTVLAKADIVLWRTQPEVFHIEVWRSFAGYVGGLLNEIGREFAAP